MWCGESELELEHIASHFTNGALGGNYVPRCVMVDLDPLSLETCRCSPIGQLFRPDNFVAGRVGSGNNFAHAYVSTGIDIRDPSLEAIRKEIELCDLPVGFQMFGALGGGTGSGMCSLLLEQLKDEYPKLLKANFTVVPGHSASDTVVEPMNAILACPSLMAHSDLTTCMDNACLYDICEKTLRLDFPLYRDLNQVMAKVIAGLTAPYRFPSPVHVGWSALKCVMVPAPNLHFFIPGYAPLNSRGVQQYCTFSAQDLTFQLLNGRNVLLAPGVRDPPLASGGGKYITALALYRGFYVPDDQVTKQLTAFQKKYPDKFVSWLDFNFLKGVCETAPKGSKLSSTLLANHTGAQRTIWSSVLRKYRDMIKRRAFLHWFYAEGISEDEFRQAEDSVQSLVETYTTCETEAPPNYNSTNDALEEFKKCLDNDPANVYKPHKGTFYCNI